MPLFQLDFSSQFHNADWHFRDLVLMLIFKLFEISAARQSSLSSAHRRPLLGLARLAAPGCVKPGQLGQALGDLDKVGWAGGPPIPIEKPEIENGNRPQLSIWQRKGASSPDIERTLDYYS